MTTPVIYVVCHNPECSWFQQVRPVAFKQVAIGMYERPAGIVCECNPHIDMKMTQPPVLDEEFYAVPEPPAPDDVDVVSPVTRWRSSW